MLRKDTTLTQSLLTTGHDQNTQNVHENKIILIDSNCLRFEKVSSTTMHSQQDKHEAGDEVSPISVLNDQSAPEEQETPNDEEADGREIPDGEEGQNGEKDTDDEETRGRQTLDEENTSVGHEDPDEEETPGRQSPVGKEDLKEEETHGQQTQNKDETPDDQETVDGGKNDDKVGQKSNDFLLNIFAYPGYTD